MKAIILAGGGGTRLWPVSRQGSPKQLEAVIGDRSMIKVTYDRVRKGFAERDIFISTSVSQREQIMAQLPGVPEEQFIFEPHRRDTASAIGYALLHVARVSPLATFVIINSDAHVRDQREYHRVISLAGGEAERRHCSAVLIGITPSYAETGYGYIKTGEFVDRPESGNDNDHLFVVEKFVEKPDAKTASQYLAHGGYLWNPTLIVGTADRFLSLYEKHLPEHAAIFKKLKPLIGQFGREAEIAALFETLPKISVDYGILEKEKNLLVLPADFGWSDIGNWRTVRDILAEHDRQNVVRGRHLGIDSAANLVYSASGKLVATVGVSDMIIVETDKALLVCPQCRAHEVKNLVAMMEKSEEMKEYL